MRVLSLSVQKKRSDIPIGSSIKDSSKPKENLLVNRDFAVGRPDIQLSSYPYPFSLINDRKWTGPCHSCYEEKLVWNNE